MGMSTHVQFFREPDEEDMNAKVDAAYACMKAGVDLPQDLRAYMEPVFHNVGFHEGTPREEAIDCLLEVKAKGGSVATWGNDFAEGYEIDLTKLPQGVTKIRVFNSW